MASIHKYVAEMLGTFVLVGLGGMSILYADGDRVMVSFGFGLACWRPCTCSADVRGPIATRWCLWR